MMLSSETEHMTQGSLGFQEKSEIFAVCPPWMNWGSEWKGKGGGGVKMSLCRPRLFQVTKPTVAL